MLNEVLNLAENIDASFRHVCLLVSLQKLSLNVLAEIVKAPKSVKIVEEFFVLFGFQQQNLPIDNDNMLL